jgi:hypothetical protein
MPKPKRRTKRIELSGSCQCGKIEFSLVSETPVPYMFCYCSICRKTGGSAFGCNIMGIRETLKIRGKRYLRSYHARLRESGKRAQISKAERWFCSECGTHLYLSDDRWPTGVWPYASAIDTPLPEPKRPISIMTRFKPSWAPAWLLKHGPAFELYPELSIADWHEREGYAVTVKP